MFQGPQCHFCGSTLRPLTRESIFIPATEDTVVSYVCDDQGCLWRLASRRRQA